MEETGDLYRIGTVANLTGVAVERLRAWERRYGFAPAHRDGRTRFYSGEQLQRLKRIKRLIDQGHPISSLAGLSDGQLRARLTQPSTALRLLPRVGLIGLGVDRLARRQKESEVEIAASWVNLEAFAAAAETAPALDAVVVQLPTLSIQPIELIKEKFPRSCIVVIYRYAADKYLRRVKDLGVEIHEWPVGWAEIERACTVKAQPTENFAKRRLTDLQLATIASADTDPSGCLGDLVELILQLNAFTDHMATCLAADEATAETAALHRCALEETSQARARLEATLATISEASTLL